MAVGNGGCLCVCVCVCGQFTTSQLLSRMYALYPRVGVEPEFGSDVQLCLVKEQHPYSWVSRQSCPFVSFFVVKLMLWWNWFLEMKSSASGMRKTGLHLGCESDVIIPRVTIRWICGRIIPSGEDTG